MKRFCVLLWIFLAILLLKSQLLTARLRIALGGIGEGVCFAEEGCWSGGTKGCVGKSGGGSLDVHVGSDLNSWIDNVGYQSSIGFINFVNRSSTWIGTGRFPASHWYGGELNDGDYPVASNPVSRCCAVFAGCLPGRGVFRPRQRAPPPIHRSVLDIYGTVTVFAIVAK
jgi:hypothetical protein